MTASVEDCLYALLCNGPYFVYPLVYVTIIHEYCISRSDGDVFVLFLFFFLGGGGGGLENEWLSMQLFKEETKFDYISLMLSELNTVFFQSTCDNTSLSAWKFTFS